MTTGTGIKRERRKKDRTIKLTENRPVPGEKEVVLGFGFSLLIESRGLFSSSKINEIN
jgi:hypothetical protein